MAATASQQDVARLIAAPKRDVGPRMRSPGGALRWLGMACVAGVQAHEDYGLACLTHLRLRKQKPKHAGLPSKWRFAAIDETQRHLKTCAAVQE